MKPIFYGTEQLRASMNTKVASEKINLPALIETFENNQDKKMPVEWLELYTVISEIYKELFTMGELSQETLEKVPYETLQIAHEHIETELESYMNKPSAIGNRDYYYEFARSLGVEEKASILKPYISEECDFI